MSVGDCLQETRFTFTLLLFVICWQTMSLQYIKETTALHCICTKKKKQKNTSRNVNIWKLYMQHCRNYIAVFLHLVPVCWATNSHPHHNEYLLLCMERIFWSVLSSLCRHLLWCHYTLHPWQPEGSLYVAGDHTLSISMLRKIPQWG